MITFLLIAALMLLITVSIFGLVLQRAQVYRPLVLRTMAIIILFLFPASMGFYWTAGRPEIITELERLENASPEYLLPIIRSQVMEAGGEITGNTKNLLDKMLLRDPRQPDGRYFMALYALQQGDEAKGKQELEKLLEELPENHRLAIIIRNQLIKK